MTQGPGIAILTHYKSSFFSFSSFSVTVLPANLEKEVSSLTKPSTPLLPASENLVKESEDQMPHSLLSSSIPSRSSSFLRSISA